MHELSIARALIEAAATAARDAGAQRVTRLRCRVGALRMVDPRLLGEAFAAAREGTACASAELDVTPVGLRGRCRACDHDFSISGWDWRCPICGGEGEGLTAGDELELVSIDAETSDEG
ncbi:MAG: hydrogenase maturation nickel metallochaperone HypA [Phycisphaerae bacterium]|nr:hydrogenase maturation nickel metallochaperone HypA [Phycisphaerae bacterium]NUQ45645.1 hydrogenase maturation nickel metallochaperone HypA [Phycisphaerae bacterium]